MRLFLALELPPDVRAALATLSEELRSRCAGWRWLRPDSLHLTLRFLGEVAPERDTSLRPAWVRAAQAVRPFAFSLGGLARFPPTGRPRILWIGVQEVPRGAQLQRLADELERTARDHGFPAERRAFQPHLTLARAARGARAPWPDAAGGGPFGPVSARDVVLFRSELLAAGARYTALARFPLGSSGQREGRA